MASRAATVATYAMQRNEAAAFVERWVGLWNSRDLEGLLEHFAEDVVFTSPVAVTVVGGDGIVRGKEALRSYWAQGLSRNSDLHFEILDFYLGIDVIVIHYQNQTGGLVCEFLRFDGGLVQEGHAAYRSDANNQAGTRPPSEARHAGG